eukprot:TRINITY_DN15193_c0_g1_i1.p1 TRINITY_DN15193_c0_g1~~TRINITY_DN15193_c0_g1_i1.p1  ORF type:complete len:709 (-),score=183.55 TRINITY_DN15193_c0_g1_i1:1254-3380(-)
MPLPAPFEGLLSNLSKEIEVVLAQRDAFSDANAVIQDDPSRSLALQSGSPGWSTTLKPFLDGSTANAGTANGAAANGGTANGSHGDCAVKGGLVSPPPIDEIDEVIQLSTMPLTPPKDQSTARQTSPGNSRDTMHTFKGSSRSTLKNLHEDSLKEMEFNPIVPTNKRVTVAWNTNRSQEEEASSPLAPPPTRGTIKKTLSDPKRLTSSSTASPGTPRAPRIESSVSSMRLGFLKQKEEEHHESIFDAALSALEEETRPGHKHSYTFMMRVVRHPLFRSVSMAVVIANTIYLGFEADRNVLNSWRRLQGGQQAKDGWGIDAAFLLWFCIELLMRFSAEKRDFFWGDECHWNVFDTLLVFETCISLAFSWGTKFSLLRILRVFRLVRIVRLVRSIPWLRSLRTMMFSILNCFADLMWAFVVIMLVMFVFSIIFDNAVADFFQTVDINDEEAMAVVAELQLHFGGLFETMVTLWAAISSGNDWMLYGNLLRSLEFGELYLLMFMFYVAFCTVGLLNVVTGIFVDSAVCTRTEDEVVAGYNEDLKRTTEEIRRIFEEADADESGTLSFKELCIHLQEPRVRAYFAGLDIDPSEARTIFTLLDTDGSGELTFEELLSGTMKLKGKARSIDMISLMYDSARNAAKMNVLVHYLEERFDELQALVEGVDELVTAAEDVKDAAAAAGHQAVDRSWENISDVPQPPGQAPTVGCFPS